MDVLASCGCCKEITLKRVAQNNRTVSVFFTAWEAKRSKEALQGEIKSSAGLLPSSVFWRQMASLSLQPHPSVFDSVVMLPSLVLKLNLLLLYSHKDICDDSQAPYLQSLFCYICPGVRDQDKGILAGGRGSLCNLPHGEHFQLTSCLGSGSSCHRECVALTENPDMIQGPADEGEGCRAI